MIVLVCSNGPDASAEFPFLRLFYIDCLSYSATVPVRHLNPIPASGLPTLKFPSIMMVITLMHLVGELFFLNFLIGPRFPFKAGVV